jgi:hypothetical protein
MITLRHRWLHFGLLLPVLALAGCGPRELPKKETYPVRGRIIIGGEPARFVHVRLEPDNPAKGRPSDGATDEDGVFTLRTYSNEDPDGAVPGRYKVVLEDANSSDEFSVPVPKGGKPTVITQDVREQEVIVDVKDEDNDLGDIAFR